MWHPMLSVARKELREIWRDRRSLGAALFYAVWGPCVMAVGLSALAGNRTGDSRLTLIVEGRTRAPALMAFLTERSVTVVAEESAASLVRARQRPVALVIPTDYARTFSDTRVATVTVVYDGSWAESNAKAARVRALLTEYGRRVGAARLILRGVSPSVASPLRLSDRDVSSAADRAATVLATLPIFVLLSAFIGGMGVAADITAGERERNSLEALLLNPVPRGAIVAGKWAATSSVALGTLALTLMVSQAVIQHPRVQAIDVPVGLTAGDAISMWWVLVPLALCASALQVLIALRTRSYKEAQTQLSLLIFLPMVPGFLFAFGAIEPDTWMRWAPLTGHHLLLSRILRGVPLAAAEVVPLMSATVAATAGALLYATALLGREDIVRRTGG